MIRLEGRKRYLLLDFNSEVFTAHDTTDTIMKQLLFSRKSIGHLVVAVMNGDKCRMVNVNADLLEFNKVLHKVMNELT